jgi:alpha/beta superfamily hydrolase
MKQRRTKSGVLLFDQFVRPLRLTRSFAADTMESCSPSSSHRIASPLTFTRMADVFHRSFFLQGPAGRLEALLWTSADAHSASVALVCHPHPLFGGTMHNKVVYQAAKSLHQAGMPVLRFNFRGVGLSEGAHDAGLGERGDAKAAIDFLAQEFPATPLLVAGFSFGSDVALRVGCPDPRVERLIGLGLPLGRTEMAFLHECVKPKLFIQGGNDEFGPRKKVEALYAEIPEPKRLLFVEGADHFFTGRLEEVGAEIAEWLGTSAG